MTRGLSIGRFHRAEPLASAARWVNVTGWNGRVHAPQNGQVEERG